MVMLLGLLGCWCGALVQVARDEAYCPVPVASDVIRAVALPLQAQEPLLLRLKPRDRARVLAALAGLVILGFALIALAWWGARFTRRYLKRPWPRSERRRSAANSEFDWADKPLYAADSDEDGGLDSGDGSDG